MPLSEQEIKVLEAVVLNPKTRGRAGKLVKEVFPDYQLPSDIESEDRLASMIEEKTKGFQETIDNLRAELAKKGKDEDWQKQLADLKRQRGWDDKRVDAFLKDLEQEFKDRKELSLAELAEYHELKNRPLTPTSSGSLFGMGPRGDTEKKWRDDIKDPNSEFMKAVRSKNKHAKRKYLDQRWNEARQEWVEMGNKSHF